MSVTQTPTVENTRISGALAPKKTRMIPKTAIWTPLRICRLRAFDVFSMTTGFPSSISPQCLHFLASGRICSAQKGHALVCLAVSGAVMPQPYHKSSSPVFVRDIGGGPGCRGDRGREGWYAGPVESPRDSDGPEKPEPTEQDRRNAELRREISIRQNAEYHKAQILALRKLGPGWEPSMKIVVYRIEDCGPTGRDDPPRVPVAVAYKVKRRTADGWIDRYLREKDTGEILASEEHEDVFEGMLDEEHPHLTIEVRGQHIPRKRYQHYWSALELYHPKSAEGLAALRESRERKREERADAKWLEENPLFAQAGMTRKDVEGGEG